ncbi:DNA repair and recombination protein RAD54B-like isoform X2 [Macrobrachium rosenbergii]|uniref:DNA repair and recombination protein RAD54B-like isoform X2 n=1 Tax=Macrobrachium rosenbergii TaxID=79674 RepID=UPI0034D7016D
MRRSAAPSQLHKRTEGHFKPPFLTPPAKRLCKEDPESGSEGGVGTSAPSFVKNNSPLQKPHSRSPSDILSLLKKPLPSDVAQDQTSGQTSFRNDEATTRCVNSSQEPSTEHVLLPSDQNPRMSAGSNLGSGAAPLVEKSAYQMAAPRGTENQEPQTSKYYSVVWCKRSNKKHKKWEGDAILIAKGRSVILKDTEGKEIGRGSGYKLSDLAQLEEGNTLPIGGKEIEIQGVISASDYSSGRCFQGFVSTVDTPDTKPAVSALPKPKPFRLPTLNKLSHSNSASQGPATPLYDPSSPDALVLPRPPSHHQWKHNAGKVPVVDVVVDPQISKNLRPHQNDGIIFLYECVMGYKVSNSFGAILADEMGLGKTLQCIALVWTLLKQGPYGRSPVVRKILVVTPSSLSANWAKEFKKWLGKEKLSVFIVDQNNKVEQFAGHHDKPVMIISYEMFVRSAEAIEALKFDLLLCDEGHRLKNANIKTTSLLTNLSCKRRVILTGTPVQNDLKEFYALVEFVNPGVFGSPLSFRHVYEDPILASQQPGASAEEKELGANRASQLNQITSLFILRRTQEIISRYLPPKVEFVVFCQPSETQVMLYDRIVGCRSVHQLLNSKDFSDHLSAIVALRKLCNHPALLAQSKDAEGHGDLKREIANFLPSHVQPNQFEETDSGKLAVVSCMLWSLVETAREKMVIVSNYTSTLDMLAQICKKYNHPFLRLDGSTPSSRRQSLVDMFNDPHSQTRVFLLSAKAGGVGLNLIGASRIILYDIDWNPATDLQAMARIWRDGQKRRVYIYRLLMTGSMDEKIYQRQIKKQSLSGAVVDARESERVHFSTAELKDLFTMHSDTVCLTHDLLKCRCDCSGEVSKVDQQLSEPQSERVCQLGKVGISPNTFNTTMDQLHNWSHIGQPINPDVIKDQCLAAASDFITFVFRNESSQKETDLIV